MSFRRKREPEMAKERIPFTSALGKWEGIAVFAYIPLHLFLLPLVINYFLVKGYMGEAAANFLLYVIGVFYMLGFGWKFLRRDFDPLMDNFLHVVSEVCISYAIMMGLNFVLNLLLLKLMPLDNPNNAAVMGIAGEAYGKTAALAIFLAPIVEEMIFRAGIFGVMRKYSRIGAYILSILAFSVYHVWAFAIQDPSYWIYMLQYVPVSYLLCRVYERCNSIWGSISMHMLVNAIAIKALTMMQELMV